MPACLVRAPLCPHSKLEFSASVAAGGLVSPAVLSTATGYRSHFLDAGELAAAGGPSAFVTAWNDREAQNKAWSKAEFAWRQGELFGR